MNLRAHILLMLVIAIAGLATVACFFGDEAESDSTDSSVEATTETQSETTDSPLETETESTVDAPASDPTAAPTSSSDALSDDPDRGVHMRSTDNLEAAPDNAEAARRADLIVVVVVEEPGDPFWNTVSGVRPGVTVEGRLAQVPSDQLRWGSSPQIFTPWTMSAVQTLKGEMPESKSILVNWWGGELPPDKFVLEGEMIFIPGEQIILYLKDCGPDHLDQFGSPYRFIKRLVLTPHGFTYLVFDGYETPLRDVRVVIDKETAPPVTETFCG